MPVTLADRMPTLLHGSLHCSPVRWALSIPFQVATLTRAALRGHVPCCWLDIKMIPLGPDRGSVQRQSGRLKAGCTVWRRDQSLKSLPEFKYASVWLPAVSWRRTRHIVPRLRRHSGRSQRMCRSMSFIEISRRFSCPRNPS